MLLLDKSGEAGRTRWLGALMDFHLDILSAHDAIQAQAAPLATLKPSQMNRLQRSMCRDRLPSVAKDSTIGVATFLEDILGVLKAYLQENTSDNGGLLVRCA